MSLKDCPKSHPSKLRCARKRLQAVVAMREDTSRRGLAPYELSGFSVAREPSGRPIVLGSDLQFSLSLPTE